EGDPALVRLGVRALAETVLIVYQAAIPPEVLAYFPAPGEWTFSTPETWEYKSKARVVALRDDTEAQCLIAVDEEDPARQVRVLYNLPERNANFNPTIQLLRKVFRFPVALNLLEVDIDQTGAYRPRALVVEPDFLVDVSAVAECFKDTGPEPLSYLARKFLPHETTAPILLGNIANFFLDRLLHAPESRWEDLIRETFQLYPFVFAPMTDAEVKDLTNQAQRHFVHLKQMASGGLAKEGIDPEHCVLEPTFFSEQYGLQGRLDLFYHHDDRSAIVELKSGKPYKPNSYGISRSHFTQTLLYDLLVRSVFGRNTDPAKYILYSGEDQQMLRFAPTVAPEQMEAIQLRNQLVGIERLLADIRPGDPDVPLLQRLRPARVAGKGFLERDFARFEQVYQALDPLEKKYFNAFAGFIAREHWLSKLGDADPEAPGGQAAVWRSSFADKQQIFSILSHLEILENGADQSEPFLVFRKTEHTHPLANFRTGDIAVLYPAETEDDTVLDHQVVKCTITDITRDTVSVALRFQQFNLRHFDTNSLWHLEPDLMDSGFVAMYRGLFEWAAADKEKRERVMASAGRAGSPGFIDSNPGLESSLIHSTPSSIYPTPNPSPSGEGSGYALGSAPLSGGGGVGGGVNKEAGVNKEKAVTNEGEIDVSAGIESAPALTSEQSRILQKIIRSKDFFLLWGPPGTGKTSVMLRALAGWVLDETTENLLLLAYTNRAVDEICEALDALGGDIRRQYLRIGSRYATSAAFREQLLSEKIRAVKKRSELRDILDRHRIFVSTVASFSQNEQLLRLKTFHRLVVDEASQLTEPQVVGLLTRFEHFTLIGDHRQLPAVTAQHPDHTRVDDPELQAMGLLDLRDSYFERLFRRCTAENRSESFDRLSRQGRMHADIMAFPNEHFYGGFLQALHPHQEQPAEEATPLVQFLPTPAEETLPGQKTNRAEAELVARLTA
ncbi:MAG TPA: AAA domain-containing protein, partial [Saprospiraceae bacterium]|nr:AAA domain-containing protein [Saprospiraceae bacterium]